MARDCAGCGALVDNGGRLRGVQGFPEKSDTNVRRPQTATFERALATVRNRELVTGQSGVCRDSDSCSIRVADDGPVSRRQPVECNDEPGDDVSGSRGAGRPALSAELWTTVRAALDSRCDGEDLGGLTPRRDLRGVGIALKQADVNFTGDMKLNPASTVVQRMLEVCRHALEDHRFA